MFRREVRNLQGFSELLRTVAERFRAEPESVTVGKREDRWRTHAVRSNGPWKGSQFVPLTRGEAVGYDADLMAFKFTMRNGQQIVHCQISRAALGDLAGGWTAGAARDLPGSV